MQSISKLNTKVYFSAIHDDSNRLIATLSSRFAVITFPDWNLFPIQNEPATSPQFSFDTTTGFVTYLNTAVARSFSIQPSVCFSIPANFNMTYLILTLEQNGGLVEGEPFLTSCASATQAMVLSARYELVLAPGDTLRMACALTLPDGESFVGTNNVTFITAAWNIVAY